MNFFTALIGTCKGTKVFIKLLSQSVIRTLWHLFILVFICSLFILVCTYPKTSHEINKNFKRLKNTFGDIQITPSGITPKAVKGAKSLLVADNLLRVNYLPAADKNDLPDIDADDVNVGVLWTPTMLTYWFKVGPDDFILFPFAYYSKEPLFFSKIKRSTILTYIKTSTDLKEGFVCQVPELSWSALNKYCKAQFISATFFGNMLTILLQVLFFVMMFAFILNLSSKNTGVSVLKYRDRFVTGIYASFPPILIASMFRAFELPFLSFNSVYVICFSIYLIVVFTRLQLDFNMRMMGNAK